MAVSLDSQPNLKSSVISGCIVDACAVKWVVIGVFMFFFVSQIRYLYTFALHLIIFIHCDQLHVQEVRSLVVNLTPSA